MQKKVEAGKAWPYQCLQDGKDGKSFKVWNPGRGEVE